MLRKILGVIAGYIVTAICIILFFTCAYLAMGADQAFKPGAYVPSNRWIVVSIILGFIAAVIGGFVSALIGKSGIVPKFLAGVILVLGLIVGIMTALTPAANETRSGSVSNFEAMQKAQEPAWLALLNPFLGAAGVIVGGSLKKRKD